MTSTWKVDSSTSVYPDSLNGDSTSLNTVITQDKLGAFLRSQLGFARGNSAPFLTLPSPGVDIPFINFQNPTFNAQIRAKRFSVALQGNRTSGSPVELLTATIDDTPRFIASSGVPRENAIINFQEKERWRWTLSNERNAFSMFPAVIPATSFSMISCDLLSEIQRHMLEPTIDGGLTWSPLWTKGEVQGYLNERLDRFYLLTGVIQTQFSVGVTSSLSEYNYPSDLIQTKRLAFEQKLSVYDDLRSFWRLEEATGTRFDSFGTNHLTSITNNPGNGVGKIGNALVVSNASSQQVAIANVSQTGLNPGTDNISVSAWFKLVSDTSGTIVNKGAVGGPPNAAGYSIYYAKTNSIPGTGPYIGVWFGDDTSVTPAQGHYTIPLDLNTWHHICVVFNRTADYVQVYFDNARLTVRNDGGSDSLSIFGSTSGPSNSTNPFDIGGNGFGTSFFDGSIDAVGVWNRVLTADEVDVLYNEGNGRELYLGQHDGPYVVLPRLDPFTKDNGDPGWQSSPGVPSSLIEEPRSPLSFQLAPTPNVDGSVEGIYVADPPTIGDACVPLPIPNFLCWGIKYGVMADMLNKEGEANDPERAKYCESRFSECVQLTRALLGFNDPEQQEGQ